MSPNPTGARVLISSSKDVTGVLTANAATDICSATFRTRERKGRRYRAQNIPRRRSENKSDGWGAAAGLPYKCRISLMVATVLRKPALCGAAGQHHTWFLVGPCQF